MSKPAKKQHEINLRRLLPDVALTMESAVLMHEADQLGIKAKISKSKKLPIISIPLTLHHFITLTPVDRGIGGYAEWFTFMQNTQSIQNVPELSSRVYVQIHDELLEGKTVESFTIQAPSLEMLLRASLSIYFEIKNIKLSPIIVV
jgi:hypothetical protein